VSFELRILWSISTAPQALAEKAHLRRAMGENEVTSNAQGILVDCNHAFRSQNRQAVAVKPTEINAYHQRRLQQCPQSKMDPRPAFVSKSSKVSHLQKACV
jgi:hypothetical protein